MTTRGWIAAALLSGSWLFGQAYYEPVRMIPWAACVVIATLLLWGTRTAPLSKAQALFAAGLLLIPLWFFPFPGGVVPLLLILGAATAAGGGNRGQSLAGPFLAAGTTLLAQWIAVALWSDFVARSHELPRILAGLVTFWANVLGAQATFSGDTISLITPHQAHPLGATWELLFDPVLAAFFVGGAVLLGWSASRLPQSDRYRGWLSGLRTLAIILLVWIPIRCGILIGIYLHCSAVADISQPLTTMNSFLSAWVHLLLLAGPVFLAAWFIRAPESEEAASETAPSSETTPSTLSRSTPSRGAWLGLAALAAALFVCAWIVHWEPVGSPQKGRVVVVERHSTWEPTTQPYDTERYGEAASYNYAAIYDYCSRFFEMGRILPDQPIDRETLRDVDVLVIKTPTESYTDDEVDAIEEYVRNGGGLLLIGDHTNVFKMTNCLNDITKRFGFTFRDDLLFRVGSAYDQLYEMSPVPHPAVRQFPWMRFAVSCSVDPGTSRGRAVIQSSGLWSLPPEYHHDNYHPRAAYRADMRYGPFIQLWATRPGKGRVLAFTDSTLFSNFCVFQEGKTELFVNMLDWLNRRGALDSPVLRFLAWGVAVIVAVGLLYAALVFLRRDGVSHNGVSGNGADWLLVVATLLAGWTIGCLCVNLTHANVLPAPIPKKPLTTVVIDRAVSETPLARGAFNIDLNGAGFGLFEQWISRLGCFTTRRDKDVFGGDCLVVISPTRSISKDYRDGLVEFVRGGGRLLVIETVYNPESTANTLLWPFEMTVTPSPGVKGTLDVEGKPTGIEVSGACIVEGGRPLATVGNHVVAAQEQFGEGTVTVLGCGGVFNDAAMGYNWMLPPNEKTRERYEVLYGLLRKAAISGEGDR